MKPTLNTRTTQLLDHLSRGGTVGYTWAVRGKHEKTSFWRIIGQDEPTLLNSQHNMYFGVHPCTAIPPTNSKGEQKAPNYVRSQIPYIAAVNCLFGEFDAKRWVPVTDEEALAELEATGKGTLAEAHGRVQERGFLKDPEPYKAQALAHIQALDCPPSVIIDSGGGFHTYWLLAEPYLITDDERRRRAKRVQYVWVDKVQSDDGAWCTGGRTVSRQHIAKPKPALMETSVYTSVSVCSTEVSALYRLKANRPPGER